MKNMMNYFILIFIFIGCQKEKNIIPINQFENQIKGSYWNIGQVEITYKGQKDYDLELRSWEFIKDSVIIREMQDVLGCMPVSYNDSGFVFHYEKFDEAYKVIYIDSAKMVVENIFTDGKIKRNLYRIPKKI